MGIYDRQGYVNREFIAENNLTQAQVLLLHLIKNGFITNAICNIAYGYRHLPARIRDLKENYGCKFQNITQKDMLNRFKQKTDYDEYHLTNKAEIVHLLGI